ncbi:sodium:solute symporter [Aquimarina sp. I32.4]|uniref:sodium:solute symporter n=1 Tax=Aquimarina sp. I32.4 TaxID=2053903 RepID=UPI000CDE96C1|nr:sodium:solute symporter [Aquimarina sp. I32.4]
MEEIEIWQWSLIIVSGLLFFWWSPLAKTNNQFYKASSAKTQPSLWMLTGSLVISWIFAKSITNAANLGLSFGLVGGVAYAAYYVSFAVAGIIIYQLRTQGGFESIHQFLASRFGQGALLIFSILIGIRLFNEVWSNTMVIGSYFGEAGSSGYYSAIILFTILTLAYALKGGLSSSIFTDVLQMGLFAILLFVILWNIFEVDTFSLTDVASSGEWSMAMGGNLLLAAILQSFSYPFHDPVLTDRGFISTPKTTLHSFLWATVIGGVCITLFSVVGIFAQQQGLQGQAAVTVSKAFGAVILLVVNFIMITSGASTLDSTFSSSAKLLAIDLQLGTSLSLGRWIMVIVAIAGTIPVFLDAEILSATTISGTMVIGLTPIFLCWKQKVPKISFFLSVGCGLLFGFILVFDLFPKEFIYTTGTYSELLWVNIWGLVCCFIAYFVPVWIKRR